MVRVAINFVIGMALIVGFGSQAAAEAVVWRFNNWIPTQHWINTDNIIPWGKRIEEATGGRVKVELTPTSLGAPDRQFDLARDGIADITWGVHGYTPGQFPLSEVGQLPFITKTGEAWGVAYWRVYEKYLAEHNEHRGVKLLGLWGISGGILFTKDEPIRELDDFDGLKLRVENKMNADAVAKLGVAPVSESATLAYQMIERGVIDGAFWQADAWNFFPMKGTIRSMTSVPGAFYNATLYTVINPESWARISAEDQQAIEACCTGEKMAARWSGNWDKWAQAGIDKMKEDGVTLHTITGAPLEKMKEEWAFIPERWIKLAAERGIDGEAVIKMLIDEQDKYLADK